MFILCVGMSYLCVLDMIFLLHTIKNLIFALPPLPPSQSPHSTESRGLQWRTAAAWKAAGVRERGLVGVRSEGEAEGEGESQGESGSEVRVRSGSESKRR